jgi:N6-L-threonylcarbamoyladenine synthase
VSLILGIETSCDECSAAVVRFVSPSVLQVLGISTFSQVILHEPYGGVVPEIASRNHLETIQLMLDRALNQAQVLPSELDAIAVTNRPGLVGALLVGVSTAKALAYAWEKPLIPIHHLEGHAASLYLQDLAGQKPPEVVFPMLLAIVSGGHTNLYCVKEPPERWALDFLQTSLVGRSRDDAAGEALDKIGKMFGFSYPAGAAIDLQARGGDPYAFPLPKAFPQKDVFDFSFSGLKTAVSLLVQKLGARAVQESLKDLCASVQEAVVEALLGKIFLAMDRYGCQALGLVGGVASNSRLRFRLEEEWEKRGLSQRPWFPAAKYCTDNAAMIAAEGAFRWRQGHVLHRDHFLKLNAIANPLN